jgi:hypothetical protein
MKETTISVPENDIWKREKVDQSVLFLSKLPMLVVLFYGQPGGGSFTIKNTIAFCKSP